MAINLLRAVEGVVTFAIIEGVSYLTSGSVQVSLTLALAAGGIIYKTGINVDDIQIVLTDIQDMLNGLPKAVSSSSGALPALPQGFSLSAAKAAGFTVYENAAGNVVLFKIGVYQDIYGNPLAPNALPTGSAYTQL